jgi:hypothetical protein
MLIKGERLLMKGRKFVVKSFNEERAEERIGSLSGSLDERASVDEGSKPCREVLMRSELC